MAKRTKSTGKGKRRNAAKETAAAVSGAARAAHFAAGGTVAAWRGRSARFDQRPKVADKHACRGYRG